MNRSDQPNPEHRSNNAILCFCIGVGMSVAAYFLGVGAVAAAALSGGDPAVVIGSAVGAIGIALLGVSGVTLTLVGAVWMLVRVIADQRGEAEEQRYRNIDR